MEKKKIEDICPNCKGYGWYAGSEAGHGCDGTEEDCARTCPVQIQIQVGCEVCGGTGRILMEEVGETKEVPTYQRKVVGNEEIQ